MTPIEVRNVSLDAPDGRRLLDDVSMSVPSGSRLAVCGPPGAGKSALMRVLVGLDDHTDGDVVIDGNVVNAVGPATATWRWSSPTSPSTHTSTSTTTWPSRPGCGAIATGTRSTSGSRRSPSSSPWITCSSTSRPSSTTASASESRSALARADALGYLFDEPFTAQDDRVRRTSGPSPRDRQADRDRTSIFTTSDVNEALTLADRIAVMHQGIVHQVGSPRELYDHPADLFVAAFLGAPAMNLVPARCPVSS